MHKFLHFLLIPFIIYPVGDKRSASINVNVQQLTHVNQHAIQKAAQAAPVAITASSWFDSIKNTVTPTTCILGSLLIGYGTMLYYAIVSAHNLENHILANWKSKIPLPALCEIPEEHVVKELLQTVSQLLGVSEDTEIMYRIIITYQELDKELKQINNYLWFYNNMQRLYLFYLLPKQDHVYEMAIAQMERLSYLKQLLISHARKLFN